MRTERCTMETMDHGDFAKLVSRHQPELSRFVGRYLRSREDGDEVVQETFLRAWAQIHRFRPGSNFGAWLMTIARFLCLARIKELQRHRPPSPLHEGIATAAAPALPEHLDHLRSAHHALPLAQREVIALRFFDGLDYRSIAEITGDTEVALRSRLHDALERLRGTLGENPPIS